MASRTPTLAEVIEGAIETYLEQHYTMLPGVVVSYDAETQTASVQPTVKQRYFTEDGEVAASDFPVIPGVVVLFPGGAHGSRLTFPLESGTPVAILFSSISLERWRSTGKILDPGNDRRNALPDAICVPGLHNLASVPHSADKLANGTQLHGKDVFIGGDDTDMVYLGDPSATSHVATVDGIADTLKGLLTDTTVVTALLAYATSPNPITRAALEVAIDAYFLTAPVTGATKVKAK